MNERILLVEDDPSLQETTTMILESAGMTVASEADGQKAINTFRESAFDMIVLDIMLPTLDGLEVCRIIRQESNVPIVMLTARDATSDLVAGLELGADDYMTKPFDSAALIARTRAVLRRATGEPHVPPISAGSIEIDPVGFRVTKDGRSLDLSATEFKLLLELIRHPGQVLTREVLLRKVWDYEYMGDSRMVDMAVKRLRTKVEANPANPTLISTVRGIGYRFNAP